MLAPLFLADFIAVCTTEGFETVATGSGFTAEDTEVLCAAAQILNRTEAEGLLRCYCRQKKNEPQGQFVLDIARSMITMAAPVEVAPAAEAALAASVVAAPAVAAPLALEKLAVGSSNDSHDSTDDDSHDSADEFGERPALSKFSADPQVALMITKFSERRQEHPPKRTSVLVKRVRGFVFASHCGHCPFVRLFGRRQFLSFRSLLFL
jgi:hypothetical protein